MNLVPIVSSMTLALRLPWEPLVLVHSMPSREHVLHQRYVFHTAGYTLGRDVGWKEERDKEERGTREEGICGRRTSGREGRE